MADRTGRNLNAVRAFQQLRSLPTAELRILSTDDFPDQLGRLGLAMFYTQIRGSIFYMAHRDVDAPPLQTLLHAGRFFSFIVPLGELFYLFGPSEDFFPSHFVTS